MLGLSELEVEYKLAGLFEQALVIFIDLLLPIFGYFDAIHKESFRLLTGSRINEFLLPQYFAPISDLALLSDNIMRKITVNCLHHFFNNNQDAHNIKFFYDNIPLFGTKHWGMFDMTKYGNNGKSIDPVINCEAHYDPGLLSIHYRSTQAGLQMQNEYGKWVIPPNDNSIAIIWAGGFANKMNPEIKPGVHRVINIGNSIPRIAIWYEICTTYQEHKELIKEKYEKLAYDEHKTGIPISKSL